MGRTFANGYVSDRAYLTSKSGYSLDLPEDSVTIFSKGKPHENNSIHSYPLCHTVHGFLSLAHAHVALGLVFSRSTIDRSGSDSDRYALLMGRISAVVDLYGIPRQLCFHL